MAAFTCIAFRNAALVRIADGRTPSRISSTARRPVRWASSYRRESGAGMAAAPVSVMPSASAMLVIVLAVPITMQ